MENPQATLIDYVTDYNQSVVDLLNLTPFNTAEELQNTKMENEAATNYNCEKPFTTPNKERSTSEKFEHFQPITTTFIQPQDTSPKQPSCSIPFVPRQLTLIQQEEQESPKFHGIFSRSSSMNKPLENYSNMARGDSAFQVFSLDEGGIPKGWSNMGVGFPMARQYTGPNDANRILASPLAEEKKEEPINFIQNVLQKKYFTHPELPNTQNFPARPPAGTIIFDYQNVAPDRKFEGK